MKNNLLEINTYPIPNRVYLNNENCELIEVLHSAINEENQEYVVCYKSINTGKFSVISYSKWDELIEVTKYTNIVNVKTMVSEKVAAGKHNVKRFEIYNG